MINRCHNPKNSSYDRYGGMGVRVCERWRDDFLHFLSDMGERPDGMTLDRIDPTSNYEPGNCRWADAKTQRSNISERGRQRAAEITRAKAIRRWADDRATRETCKNGHSWETGNVYLHPAGWQMCRECRRIAAARAYEKKKFIRGSAGSLVPPTVNETTPKDEGKQHLPVAREA